MYNKMRKGNWITLIGLAASLAGFAITQVQSWVSEQQMNAMIDEKIDEALAKREEEEEEMEES